MRRLTKYLFIVLSTAFFLFLPVRAHAFDPFGTSCQGQALNSSVCKDSQKQGDKNPIAGPNGVVQRAADLIAVIGGIAAVITIIVSGIMFTTAGGAAAGQRAGDNPTKAKNARATLTNALIGLIIIALAWAIVSFVVQKVISS